MRPPNALKGDVVPCNIGTVETAAVQIRGKKHTKRNPTICEQLSHVFCSLRIAGAVKSHFRSPGV